MGDDRHLTGYGYLRTRLSASHGECQIFLVIADYRLIAFRVIRMFCIVLMVFGVVAGLSARAVASASGLGSVGCLIEMNCHDHEHDHPVDGHDHNDSCPDHHHHHHGNCCVNLPLTVDKALAWSVALISMEIRLEWPPTKSIPDDPFLADEKPPLI